MKTPAFVYNEPSTWDRYQAKMKENLFSVSRTTDPIKIDRAVDDWVNVAKNGTINQCYSMLSVVEYFFPGKIHESYFKSRIEFFYNRLRSIIKTKETEGCSSSQKQTAPVKVSVPETPKKKSAEVTSKDKNFDVDFPTFEQAGFPNTASNIFDLLLNTKNNS